MARPVTVEANQTKPQPADDEESHDLIAELTEHLPAWMTSLASHLVLLILLALISAAGHGLGDGLGMVVEAGGSDGMGGDASGPGELLAAPSELTSTSTDANSKLQDLTNIVSQALEDLPKIELPDFSLKTGATSATAAAASSGDGHGHGDGKGDGEGDGEGVTGGSGQGLSPVRTQVFGLAAEGTRFVYVFDRSESMTSTLSYSSEGTTVFSITPLEAAKAELLRSLDDLDPRQQFQLVFYNHEPVVFNLTRGTGRLLNANKDNKRRAATFVTRIIGAGGTRHMEPLEIALRMRPDVIFLLTDGEAKDDPQPFEISQLKDKNKSHAKINVIQFCYTPRPEGTLVDLAKQNGGKHVFFNIAQLGPGLPGGPKAPAAAPPNAPPGNTPAGGLPVEPAGSPPGTAPAPIVLPPLP